MIWNSTHITTVHSRYMHTYMSSVRGEAILLSALHLAPRYKNITHIFEVHSSLCVLLERTVFITHRNTRMYYYYVLTDTWFGSSSCTQV